MLVPASRALVCAAFVAVLVAALGLPALAEGPAGTPAPEPSEIVHVTTTDRQDEPLSKTSRPTFVVDRATIVARGARTVADALRMIPGVSLFRYGAYGASANYGLMGATSEQTLVLLNGFPVAQGSTGAIDLGTFSTAGVDRIEIVEGGGSTLYGSNAVGGVINIITGNASRTPYVALSDGTLGDREARVEGRIGELSAAAERHLATNVYDYPSLDGLPAGTRANAQAGGSALRADFRSNAERRFVVEAALGSNATKVGVPGGLTFLTPNAQQSTAQFDGHVTVTRHGEHSALSVSASGARQALAYNDPDNGGESDTYDARGQISLRDVVAGERSSLVAGIDLSRESALIFTGPSSSPPAASAALAQSAAYAQYRGTLGAALDLTLGLRGEHDAPQGSVLVPSFGALVRLGAARLAANYAGTFRVPTLDELYYPGFSNPALMPERSRNVDATLSLPLGNGTASLTWFDRHAVNLIALDANFVPQNVARASIAGFVFLAHSSSLRELVVTLGLTNLYRALNETPGQPPSRLEFEPVLTTLVGLEKRLRPDGGVAFGIDAQVRGPHAEGMSASRDGATTLDAYVRARLARQVVATVRARNLGNERYAPIFGYPAPGRALEVEVSTR